MQAQPNEYDVKAKLKTLSVRGQFWFIVMDILGAFLISTTGNEFHGIYDQSIFQAFISSVNVNNKLDAYCDIIYNNWVIPYRIHPIHWQTMIHNW